MAGFCLSVLELRQFEFVRPCGLFDRRLRRGDRDHLEHETVQDFLEQNQRARSLAIEQQAVAIVVHDETLREHHDVARHHPVGIGKACRNGAHDLKPRTRDQADSDRRLIGRHQTDHAVLAELAGDQKVTLLGFAGLMAI